VTLPLSYEDLIVLAIPNFRRVVSTLGVIAVPVLTACESDSSTAPAPVVSETLNLSKLGAIKIPALVDSFDIDTGASTLHYETYIESGQLTLTGNPSAHYNVDVRSTTYSVAIVNGTRSMIVAGRSRQVDRGAITRDTNGNLIMTSEFIWPLTHTARPLSTGVQMAFRVPGDDIVYDLFYRREPD
jgi:hypothetical protein